MRIERYLDESKWSELTRRPQLDMTSLTSTVQTILDDIRVNGDEAVLRYEEKFDHVSLSSLRVSEKEFSDAETRVSAELKSALELAHANIHRFHSAQQFEGVRTETQQGVVCWQKSVAIERVGLYVPGGTAPLFSTVLMLLGRLEFYPMLIVIGCVVKRAFRK